MLFPFVLLWLSAEVTPAQAADPPAAAGPLRAEPNCPFDKQDSFLGVALRAPPGAGLHPAKAGPFGYYVLDSTATFEGVPIGADDVQVYFSPAWVYQVNVRIPDPDRAAQVGAALDRLCGPPARVIEGTKIWTTGRVVTQWQTSPAERAGIYVSVYD